MSSGGKKGGSSGQSAERTKLSNPITFYKEQTGKYPSNAEVWWAYKRPVESGTDEQKYYLEVFDPSIRHQITVGNQPAARGHYLLKAFHKDRSGASGIDGLPVESAGAARPQATAFFAGRVFFSGVASFGFSTTIWFSQILERADQANAAHQSLDPTNEDVRDLLPNDGGTITIPEMSQVHAMYAMGMSLLIFAENGVWEITGSEGIGFRANDYSVNKLSGTPAISNLSFVMVEGAVMWWNKSGIHIARRGQGGTEVISATEETIKEFYNDIPVDNKFYAKGAYNSLTKRVQWVYRSTAATSFNENFEYDRILTLDTNTGAFYPWTVGESPQVKVRGIFSNEGYTVVETIESVLVGEEEVYSDVDPVVFTRSERFAVQDVFKYIIAITEPVVPETPA